MCECVPVCVCMSVCVCVCERERGRERERERTVSVVQAEPFSWENQSECVSFKTITAKLESQEREKQDRKELGTCDDKCLQSHKTMGLETYSFDLSHSGV